MSKYEKIITEVHQAVLGVPNTDDRGIAGDIKEIKAQMIRQNGRIIKNTIGLIALGAFLTGLGVLEWTDVINLFG